MRKTSLIRVILVGLCAVLWIARFVLDLVYTRQIGLFLTILDGICAAVWAVSFAVNLRRHLTGR